MYYFLLLQQLKSLFKSNFKKIKNFLFILIILIFSYSNGVYGKKKYHIYYFMGKK